MGTLTGNDGTSYRSFLGVPYAHAGRFRYAEPVESWEGTLDATHQGPLCCQYRQFHPETDNPGKAFYHRELREGLEFNYSEDCLNMNIFTPPEGRNHPVLVYIHGGSFNSGGNAEHPFSSGNLARMGIVTAVMNYRLGALGYLTNQEIQDEYGRDGNFGLDDQVTALRWVKNHIAEFGGDPGNITVMGQSAGAISLQYICLNHANEGLFRRAIMLSGAGRFPSFALPRQASQTHGYWKDLMDMLGCRTLDELRRADIRALLDAVEEMKKTHRDNLYNTMPVIDGHHLDRGVEEAIRKPLDIDYLVSVTNCDMFAPLLAAIGRRFSRDNNGYMVFFDVDSPGDGNKAFHSSDLRYIFQQLEDSWRPYDEKDAGIALLMASSIAAFARTGNPDNALLSGWKRRRTMRISRSGCRNSHIPYLRLVCNYIRRPHPVAGK